MKYKINMFIGAFLVTFITVGAISGLMAVDLSTDRYISGQHATLFLIDNVDSNGAEFSWMGRSYILDGRAAARRELLLSRRWVIPPDIRFAGGMAVRLMELWEEVKIYQQFAQ